MDKVAGFALGSIDAYIYIDHKGTRLKTKVVTQDKEKKLRWDQQMLLPLELPLSNDSSRRIRAAAANNNKKKDTKVLKRKKTKAQKVEDSDIDEEKPPDDDLIDFNM